MGTGDQGGMKGQEGNEWGRTGMTVGTKW